MKILFAVVLAVSGATTVHAAFEGTEHIARYDVDVRLAADGILHVREEIVYDFANTPDRHGIYRDLPLSVSGEGGTRKLRYSFEPVIDGEGERYNVARSFENGQYRLKIGDADTFVTGQKTYVLRYTVGRAPAFGPSEDLLLWNAIGTGWDVPIADARATLTVEGAQILFVRCLVGSEWSADEMTPCEARDLPPSHGITLQAQFAHGAIAAPTSTQQLLWALNEHWGVLVFLVVLFLVVRRYVHYGRDPDGRSTIVHEYDPPAGMTPAEVGAIVDLTVDNADLSATLVDLAARGYLRINPVQPEGKKKPTDYVFEQKNLPDDTLKGFECALLERLFQSGTSVSMNSLKQKMASTWSSMQSTIYTSLTDDGYFRENPQTVRIVAYVLGGLVTFGGVFSFALMQSPYGSLITSFAVIASGLLILGFAHAFPARTAKGVAVREHTLGLKRYFTVAEKARMSFEEAEQRYSLLLAYALALGVATQWTKRFDGLLKNAPDWYGGQPGTFNALAFASSMERFQSTTASTLSAPAPSSSGSGSGGGVGGGGGGGGGGSW